MKFDPPKPVNKWNSSAVKYAIDDTVKKVRCECIQVLLMFRQ